MLDTQISAEAEAGANDRPEANDVLPRRKSGRATRPTQTRSEPPSPDRLERASLHAKPKRVTPAQPPSGCGQCSGESQSAVAASGDEIPLAIGIPSTNFGPPAEPHMGGQLMNDDQRSIAAHPELSEANPLSKPTACAPHSTEFTGGQTVDENHGTPAARETVTGGHASRDTQPDHAAGNQLARQRHTPFEDQNSFALVGEITAVYRRYEDLRRARQRVELQAMATCRTVCGGDKVAGMKLYRSPTAEVAVWLMPYQLAMEPLNLAITEQEKLLTKLGRQLPVREWMEGVPGLSPRFLAAIVGECGIGPGEFRTVSALWKRMGMAVIGGQRQRRVTGDAALEHGYVARRRSLMWNIGDQVAVRQGVRNPKDAAGERTGAVAINPWGQLYLDRKAYELAREVDGKPITPMHAHNRAKRYVEKRLLRELWQEWRRAIQIAVPMDALPAAA